MPSQGSQQLSSSPLCLSLLKFSYATVSNESIAPIPWIHLSSKNSLFAVFETWSVQLDDGHVEERQKFKVLRDPEIMEEIDLNALSAGAHRAVAQAPHNMSQIPEVTVIVKVPMIAIKYPMPNGQIRRFQIRFTTNEDYYEAMKILSRANIPTVEAGTFPVHRSHEAPVSITSNYLTPSDSASQIGLPTEGSTIYTNVQPNRAALAPSNYMTSSSRVQPASGVQSAMAPPRYLPMTTDSKKYHQPLQQSMVDQSPNGPLPNDETVGPRSNISLSTATTLLNAASRPDAYGIWTRSGNGATTPMPPKPGFARQDLSDRPQHLVTTEVMDGNGGLGLPPKRELPFQRILDDATPKQQGTQIAGPQEVVNEESTSVTSTVSKGKRKRAPTQKATKLPTVKKARATTTRKRTDAGSTKDDTPIPTVEDLLQQGGDHFPRCTRRGRGSVSGAQKTQPQIKKAQSMEIPETDISALGRATGGGAADTSPSLENACVTRRITRAASKSLACIPAAGTPAERYMDVIDNGLPCTSADQTLIPLTPGSPAAATNKISRAPASPPPCEPETSLDPTRTDQTQPSRSFTCGDPTPSAAPAETAPSSPDARALSYAQACLEADPQFAQGKQKLQMWSDLPSATRVPALRSYFCQLIMDPNFPGLCKALSSFWERQILESRIEHLSGLEDDARGRDTASSV